MLVCPKVLDVEAVWHHSRNPHPWHVEDWMPIWVGCPPVSLPPSPPRPSSIRPKVCPWIVTPITTTEAARLQTVRVVQSKVQGQELEVCFQGPQASTIAIGQGLPSPSP
eukprot:11179844-Lingulodinium_polyedra.AAC.3